IDHGNAVATFTAQLGVGTATPFDWFNPVPSATIAVGQFAVSPSQPGLPVDYGFSVGLTGTLKLTDTASGQFTVFDVPMTIYGNPSGGYWFDVAAQPDVLLGDHDYAYGSLPNQQLENGGPAYINILLDAWVQDRGDGGGPIEFPTDDG